MQPSACGSVRVLPCFFCFGFFITLVAVLAAAITYITKDKQLLLLLLPLAAT